MTSADTAAVEARDAESAFDREMNGDAETVDWDAAEAVDLVRQARDVRDAYKTHRGRDDGEMILAAAFMLLTPLADQVEEMRAVANFAINRFRCRSRHVIRNSQSYRSDCAACAHLKEFNRVFPSAMFEAFLRKGDMKLERRR